MTGSEKKGGAEEKPAAGKCPICGKSTKHEVRPFCSARCADIDLGRWVSGAYVITGGQEDADEDGDEGFAKETGGLDRGKDPEAK